MSQGSKRSCILAGCGVIIVIILFRIVWFILDHTVLYRNDPSEVSGRFLQSLVRNDARTAKSLTTAEQWDRIDAWMAEREEFSCRTWDLDDLQIYGGGFHNEGTAYYDWTYFCAAEGYRLSIDDIKLEQTEDGYYQIVRWGKVCESWEWGYTSTLKCD